MKLKATKEQLLGPLARVIGASDRKGAMQVLECVMLETGPDGLRMTATNTEIQMIAHDDIAGLESVSVLLHARKLFDILRALPDKSSVDLSFAAERCTITSGRSRFSLGTLPAENFPAFDGVGGGNRFSVEPSALRHALRKCASCMAANDVRYYLNGISLRFDGEGMECAGSDGHRLAMQSIPLAAENKTRAEMILPRQSAIELIKLLPDEAQPEPCEIVANERTLWIDLPGITFASKLIEGRYPDFRRVLPPEYEAEFQINCSALMDTIKRVDILSNDHHSIILEMSGKTINLTSMNQNQEESEDAIQVECDAETRCGYNSTYLMDALGNIDTDQVDISINGERGTMLRNAGDDGKGFFIVMPMRL
jgi:DNA polymerase-3 subunit beta